jgi:hypothetical protein
MGGNITCVVVIIIEEMAKDNSLSLEQMSLVDPVGNEIV